MNFVLYDITFLILFTLGIVIFLYKRRHNLKREGLLYLYKTSFGIKLLERATKKYRKILKPLQYVIVTSGYILLGVMLWLLVKFTWFYLASPSAAKALKVPVVMPLIPYLPNLFNISYLPPFYFTYWIIIIAIIAIPHEFSHGLFARLNKIKILSTGFGFLGPFLAAFVEQDDKQMKKAKIFPQLSVLAAGTFANVIMTVLFGLIFWLFFVTAFTPAGVNFNTYSISAVNISSISGISFVTLDNATNYTLAQVSAGNKTYFATQSMLDSLNETNATQVILYDDSPALKSKLVGAVYEINGIKITNPQQLNASLSSFNPGDNVTIATITSDKQTRTYNITLSETNGRAFLGIGLLSYESSGVMGKFYSLIAKIKDPFIYYESRIGDIGIFIDNLLWWIVLVNLSVALMNMLPAGMFDGGRFFYLTILAITKKKSIAEKAFKVSTWILLGILALLIIKWALVIF